MIELFQTIKGVQTSTGRRFATGREVVRTLMLEYGVRSDAFLNADNPYRLANDNAEAGRTTIFQDYSYQWQPVAEEMTTIECTKPEFRDALLRLFVAAHDMPNSQDMEIIDGLVRQAFAHRGAYEGSNYVLSINFKVTDAEIAECPFCGAHKPSSKHLGNCDRICDGVTTAEAAKATKPAKTMTDYQPGTAVKRMLITASYVRRISAKELHLIDVAVEAERTEQGITTTDDEQSAWISEYVHELRACSSHC